MDNSDIRMDLKAALRRAFMDQTNGVDCGCIVEAGCVARNYHNPEDAAYAFIEGAVDAVIKVLHEFGDDLLNDLAADADGDYALISTSEPKPLGVRGHLQMIRQRTVEAYDTGRLDAEQLKVITPEMIARWRTELEKPA